MGKALKSMHIPFVECLRVSRSSLGTQKWKGILGRGNRKNQGMEVLCAWWGGVTAAKPGGSGPGLLIGGLTCHGKVQQVIEHN